MAAVGFAGGISEIGVRVLRLTWSACRNCKGYLVDILTKVEADEGLGDKDMGFEEETSSSGSGLPRTIESVSGVIARCSPLFEYPPTALIVITSAGATTSFLAATTGILQNDLKRVIAYSTCSQLGYMIFACGISNYSVSIFHLMNHAFFKALLFLSAGSVIHAMSDEQDMRKMGGLASSFPFTYAMMLMGSLSLIGFPFLTGFYSKDVILELAYTKYTISRNFAFWLGSVSVLFTSYYSFRSLFLTFLVPTNSFGRDILQCHDVPIPMAIPLILLALGSLFVGYLAKV
ncbi:NADH-ubiquinone oxidoreductase chain 5 [Glycine max]|uniref:NADH-ubiquinone oxidoreductase chain 5 n=1 Tax=Glycine max TaxID=3847 RepID=UPI001B357E67|nr:NADH-ubiquinone oxidoreductase chain 5-like [Glycine max]